MKVPVVVAAGTVVTDQTPETLRDRPKQDYVILGELFDAEFVDPLTAIRGRFARWLASRIGPSWFVAARAVRASRKASAIIAMGDDVGVPIAAFKVLFFSRTPLIMISWHMRSKRARVFIGRLRMHRQVQWFLAQSERQKCLLIDSYQVPADKIEVTGAAIDHRYFTMDPAVSVRRQISSAGVAARDYATLIEAAKGLDAEVKIEANSAWFNEELSFDATSLPPNVELTDDGTTPGLRCIYAQSKIVVVPLQDVGYAAGGNTVLEGMAMEKPVVASSIEMLGDYIVDGESGLLVPPEDAEALHACLQRLLDDDELCARLGAAARERVLELYTRDRYGEYVQRAVERVTAGRRS